MRFLTQQPAFAIRRLWAGALAFSLLLALGACATSINRAPVVNRDTTVGVAPIIQGRGGAIGAPQPGAQPPIVAAAPPVADPAGTGVAPGVGTGRAADVQAAVVESAAIVSGQVDSRPLAGDAASETIKPPAAAGGAPIITMTPDVAAPPAPVQESGGVVAPAATTPAATTPGASAPAAVSADAPSQSTATGSPAGGSAPEVVAAAPAVSAGAPQRFIWPATGAVTKSFTDPKSMGIAIAGKAGAPVAAAADGKVIFSGLGPRGYGKLLIVKHDDELLSVYANNRALLVKEGQVVRQGERIAELGSSGTDSPRLHFEIRHLGKPVDPIGYLPARP